MAWRSAESPRAKDSGSTHSQEPTDRWADGDITCIHKDVMVSSIALLSSKTIQNCQSWETINYPFIYTSLYCILLDPLILERWPQKNPKFIWPGQLAKPRQGGLTRKGMDGLRGSPVSTESGTQWNHGRQASQPPPKSTQAWIWHTLAAFPSISCPISISMSCVPVALETAGRELPFKALQMSGFTLESLELGHDVQLEENQIHSTNIKIH